jgi:hypothetical protein
MPALTTREEARQYLRKLFDESLERFIPADQSVPLRGQTMRDFEDQVEQVRRTVLPAMLEERAALEPTASVETAGHCPSCHSNRVYLEKALKKTDVISPHGPLTLMRQRARCRCCGRSFSPSVANAEPAGGVAADASGGRAAEPGIGHPIGSFGGQGLEH